MKARRHHNNRGQRQTKTGKTTASAQAIARRLGVPFEGGHGKKIRYTQAPEGLIPPANIPGEE